MRRSCRATVRRWDWRAPLTGNELYLNGLNSGTMPSHAALAKAGNIAGSAAKPAKRAKRRDADHRRDQDEAVGPRQPLVVDGVERVFHRQRAAIGEADDMERLGRADAPAGLANRQTRCRVPVLPFDIGQRRRHGAVRRHPDRHRDEAPVAVVPCNVAQAVGRIGQAMEENDCAERRPVGLEDIRAVPIRREVAGIDRTARVVAVARGSRLLVELVDNFCPHLAKDRLFGRKVGSPVSLVDLRGVPVARHVGMPWIKRRSALGIPGAGNEQRCRGHDQQHEHAPK